MERLIINYDEDFLRYSSYIEDKFEDLEQVTSDEFYQAFEEYQELFPMDLVVYESTFEMIFYNRPIGEFEHYWKTPNYGYIWKQGEFLSLAKEKIKDFLFNKVIKS